MDVFCITSVTVQVTTVSPRENVSGASLSMEIIPTVSKVDGVLSFTRFCVSDTASNAISCNCSISGGVVSCTVMFCDAIAIFPDPSMAVHMMVDIPSGNVFPALFSKESIPLSSSATAFPTLTAVSPPVASTIISSGTCMIGFVKSFGIGLASGNSFSSSVIFSDSDIISD